MNEKEVIQKFKDDYNKSKQKIDAIKNKLSETSLKDAHVSYKRPDGYTKEISQMNINGKKVYQTYENGKNVMTFTSEQSLKDYLENK